MRYRRVGYRYTMAVRFGQTWPFGEAWQSDRLRLLFQGPWRPDADMSETPRTVEIVVDLAGVDEDDFEIQLFEDVLVVEGHRPPPSRPEGAVYHAAAIRHGPFRVELPLPARVDPERVDVRLERGLLRITLPKSGAAG